jgi:hypothetical protein
MLARAIVCAILATPCLAHAQFSLVATQIGPKEDPIGTSYTATCAKDACRVTLPVYVANVGCVLNVRVSRPTRHGLGKVIFAAGPCQGGFKVAVDKDSFFYQLDEFGAVSETFTLMFVPASPSTMVEGPFGSNDLVFRPSARFKLRLDLIATGAR